MIQVLIKKHNKQISSIQVTGHANSNEYGKDLVCAGVSTACVGIANALDRFDSLSVCSITLEEGLCKFIVHDSDEKIQTVLETFVIILETIEQSYSQYIKIKETEV